jgi:hypothetical protein
VICRTVRIVISFKPKNLALLPYTANAESGRHSGATIPRS